MSSPKPALSMLFLGDILSAILASVALSPFVAAIDKAIVQYASGSATVGSSVMASARDMVTRPLYFLRRPEFLMVFGVYFATYTAANCISTTCEYLDRPDDLPKFVGVSSTNIVACISKDMMLTRMFGKGPVRPVPLTTLSCFCARDCLTIAASFNIPKVVSGMLQRDFGFSQTAGNGAAQLFCPVVVQLFSTPVHLLGLGFYNNPGKSMAFYTQEISEKYVSSATGRMGRILPAFGFGGIGNKFLRDSWRSSVRTPTSARKAATSFGVSGGSARAATASSIPVATTAEPSRGPEPKK